MTARSDVYLATRMTGRSDVYLAMRMTAPYAATLYLPETPATPSTTMSSGAGKFVSTTRYLPPTRTPLSAGGASGQQKKERRLLFRYCAVFRKRS
eukprot:2633763-Pyramimonas_sp.AAC.1